MKKKWTALCMVFVMLFALTGCGSKKNETITLEVYSQLANYSGLQTGWIADILKDKFNVKLKITPDGDGFYETRMESGDLAILLSLVMMAMIIQVLLKQVFCMIGTRMIS